MKKLINIIVSVLILSGLVFFTNEIFKEIVKMLTSMPFVSGVVVVVIFASIKKAINNK